MCLKSQLLFGTKLVGTVPWAGVFDSVFKPVLSTIFFCSNASIALAGSLYQKSTSEQRFSERKPHTLKQPVLSTKDDLLEQAKSSNRVIYNPVTSSDLAGKTLEERDACWLKGPIPFGPGCVLSRRFGPRQPNKVRLIDDLSKSGINSTVQRWEESEEKRSEERRCRCAKR